MMGSVPTKVVSSLNPTSNAEGVSAATRRRLLDAAGVVFADAGFERAAIRDICARANANVAAVRYHFGGKYELYEALVGEWFDRADRDPPLGLPTAASADKRLRAFTAKFVARLLDREKPSWHARIMAREMIEPTGVLDTIVEQTMRPTIRQLRAILEGMVGKDCPSAEIERAMLSVIAQCVFYVHCRPVLERLFPKHAGEPDVVAIADHIATFSIAGVRAIGRRHARGEAKGRR